MIDSTKGPIPLWKRYAMIIGLAVVLIVGGYYIYSKDLHQSSNSAANPPAAAPPPHAATPPTVAPVTKTPIAPISNRSPFG